MTTEEQTQTPETAVTQSPPAKQTAPNREGRSELIKFGILALVFFGIIVVVALSRPLIFDWLLPAIVQPVEVSAPEGGMGGAAEDAAGYPAPETETGGEHFLPSVVTGEGETAEEGETAVGDSPDPVEEPTAEPEPVFHVVQTGETLTRIAEQHNVPVRALMEANGLINPNYIQAGQTLLIPPLP